MTEGTIYLFPLSIEADSYEPIIRVIIKLDLFEPDKVYAFFTEELDDVLLGCSCGFFDIHRWLLVYWLRPSAATMVTAEGGLGKRENRSHQHVMGTASFQRFCAA